MSNLSEEEIQNILDELNTVRPEVLNTEAKRLFEAIMQIADDRDKYKDLYNKEKEKNTFGVVSKDKINNIIKKLDNLEIRNHNLTAESFAKNILKDLLEDNI